jgi:hypothetical protein
MDRGLFSRVAPGPILTDSHSSTIVDTIPIASVRFRSKDATWQITVSNGPTTSRMTTDASTTPEFDLQTAR